MNKHNFRRVLSLVVAVVFFSQTVASAAGSGLQYRTQAEHFYNAFKPETVWDQPAEAVPDSEIERRWREAIEKERGALFANHLSDFERAEHFDLWIERLRRNAFFGESALPGGGHYANHPLDSYGVLGQTVHTREYETRLSKIKRALEPVKNAVGVTVRETRKTVRAFGQGVAQAALSLVGVKPEEVVSASADEARPELAPTLRREAYFSYVDPKNLNVEVVNADGQVVKALNLSGQDISFLYGSGRGGRLGERSFHSRDGRLTLRLVYQGQVLHEFKNNLTAIAAYDRYLVFIEPGRTWKEKGVVNLSFIDLDYFQGALGKTVLPIFRVPVALGANAVERAADLTLEVTPDGLALDGKVISPDVLDFFSWMQQLSFNTTVSLVDPRYYDSTTKVLASLIEQFDKSLEVTAQGLDQQLERAGVNFDLFAKYKSDLISQLKVRAEIGAHDGSKPRELERAQSRLAIEGLRRFDRDHAPDIASVEGPAEMLTERRLEVARREADKIASDVKAHLARAKKFGEQLASDRNFQATLQGYNQAIEASRKLTNRLNLFWSRLIMPQPLGAPKIQQALGFLAASVTSADAWKNGGAQAAAMTKEAVLELFANRKAHLSLEVLTGAALATLYPAEAGQFMFYALDMGRTLLTNFLGWVDSWGKITSTAWSASWAWFNPGLLWETYFSKDRFQKLAIGVGALYGTLLAIAGTMHVLVNGTHFAKAMLKGEWRRQREEGIGFWKALRNGFVSYVKKDKQNYYDALARSEKKRRGQDLVITLPDGNDFKGLFRSLQNNDFVALAAAERNGESFDIELALADGRLLKGLAVPAAQGLPGQIRMNMDLPDGSRVARSIVVKDGDWLLMGQDELLHEGVGAEIRLAKTSLVGVVQNTEWTAAEEKALSELLEKLAQSDEAMAKKLEAVRKIPIIGRLFKQGNGDIETLGQALRHFMFGYSSWTHSTKLFGQIWNPWFLLRNFWIRPRAWFTMMAYPNIFNRMVWNNGVATYFDGGKRLVTESFSLRNTARFIAQFPYYIGADPALKELEEFEKQIIPVEQQLHQAAMRIAFVHLTEVALKDRDFVSLLSQGGKVHPFDSKFKELNKKLRVYFESYFTNAFEGALRLHLKRVVGLDDAAVVGDRKLKELGAQANVDLTLNDSEAEALVRRAIEVDRVEERARSAADDFIKGWWERRRLAHWNKIGRALDSNFNKTLERYKIAAVQMENEEAMARATRQYMVGMVVDKPIELLFTFLFLAGIDEGVLKPLHDEMWSENSWFYTSRYVFWNGYFIGIMISLLADVWMKIQMDARVDALGGFSHVPTEEEYNKGFLAYYRKNFFDGRNKWWDNQKSEIMLSYRNMPAYFMTALLTNLLTLGRFDLDSFIAVYKGALLPTGGLGFKLENAFEMSANYTIGQIPHKFHVDPRVQEYRNKSVGRLRLGYNFMYKTFYENPLGNLLGNWMTMPVQGIGPRAWMRQFYPDQMLPTELIVNYGLRPLQASGVPTLVKVADACDALLTTNHTDAFKIKPKVAK